MGYLIHVHGISKQADLLGREKPAVGCHGSLHTGSAIPWGYCATPIELPTEALMPWNILWRRYL